MVYKQILVKKLKRNNQLPPEIFAEALEEYEPEDPEFWAQYFPPGYRKRMAPQVGGEIYSTGMTGKKWAKEWVKEKGLGECDEAREMIPACASLDAIILMDRVKGAINHVGTEKLARKIMGLRMKYAKVEKEGDWKPKKGGKSKVDAETQKWYDPELKPGEHIFVNRDAEDEVRGEMDREASLLKARAKLAEQAKKG